MQPFPGFSIGGARHGHSTIPATPQPTALVDAEGNGFRVLDLTPGAKLVHGKAPVRSWVDQRKRGRVVVAIPDVPVGKSGKGPASVHQQAVLRGDLPPTSVFSFCRESAVIASP